LNFGHVTRIEINVLHTVSLTVRFRTSSHRSPIQTAAIWDAIRALPSDDRPHQVRHAFDLVLLNLRQDTGEVLLTRDQLAEEIGCAPKHVSPINGNAGK